MTTQTSLSKRIRRHVTGRVREFFAATAPGFEPLCFEELAALPLSVKEANIVPGGLIFKGRIHDCYLANLKLRTANRILMRLAEFKATNFSQLEKKLTDFPWELFLPFLSKPESLLQIAVTSRHSRL
jgi:putative N6-adenine-specific DNA methylase